MKRREDLRNLAFIAHVDHGKTTMVDGFLEYAGLISTGHQDAFLDSNPLERERGITILAKNVAFTHQGIKVNVIDTPGHADFSGEVERVLGMADGALLLVDAAEGPMPQTTFVLRKALALGLKPLVVINKIDRPDARPEKVLQDLYDLFIDLGATDEQVDFPLFYASGKERKSGTSPEALETTLDPLLQGILKHIPGPEIRPEDPLQVMITNFEYDRYVGRIGIGRIVSGSLQKRSQVALIKGASGEIRKFNLKSLEIFEGLGRQETEKAEAGEIIALSGIDEIEIGDTISDPDSPQALPRVELEEPTLSLIFGVNDSPFAGREGSYVTSRQLRERLLRAVEADVAFHFEDGDRPEEFNLSGRGLLHFGVLIENMRREDYEFTVSSPRIVIKEIDGKRCEPFETAIVDVPTEYASKVIGFFSQLRGQTLQTESHGTRSLLHFSLPARALIGARNKLLTLTHGEAILNHRFEKFSPYQGPLERRKRGAMIAVAEGRATEYALIKLADRGTFFIEPGERVYEGMVVGEHCKEEDILVGITKEKALTNVRSATKEATVTLKASQALTLEEALEWIADDEVLEVCPKTFRIRKRLLKAHQRKASKAAQA